MGGIWLEVTLQGFPVFFNITANLWTVSCYCHPRAVKRKYYLFFDLLCFLFSRGKLRSRTVEEFNLFVFWTLSVSRKAIYTSQDPTQFFATFKKTILSWVFFNLFEVPKPNVRLKVSSKMNSSPRNFKQAYINTVKFFFCNSAVSTAIASSLIYWKLKLCCSKGDN